MITLENVSQKFGSITALNNINLTLRDGEITGLLGLNGAGKSTLMRLIYGLLQPTQGRISIDGMNVAQHPELVRKSLGVLPDDTGLYKRLSARENINYFGELQDMTQPQLDESREQLIKLLGMESIADRCADGFSLGERMKTALARAIVHQPQHILLDEPTNGLDVITTRAVRKMLLTLRDQGRCILFSSHLMHEVSGLCDRIIIITNGCIVADGSVAEVISATQTASLEDAFIQLSQANDEKGLRDV
jgi:sodium transport system ATP-binding protein